MSEAIKNKIILVLSVLLLVFFITSVRSCNNTYRMQVLRDHEMAKRLDVEEESTRSSQDKIAFEEKAKSAEKELAQLRDELSTAKKALVQEQLTTQGLKDELAKAVKVKEALEEESKNKSKPVKVR